MPVKENSSWTTSVITAPPAGGKAKGIGCTAPGAWLVNFPAYGPEADLAEAPILEEDLMKIPAMDAQFSQRIQAEFAAKKRK